MQKQQSKKIQNTKKYRYLAKCINQNQAIFICQSPNCQKFAFQCFNEDCSCQLDHTECLRIQLISLTNKLSSKKMFCTPLKNKLNQIIENLIDFASQLRDKALQKIQCFGLNQIQQKFLLCLQQKQLSSINGKLIDQICRHVFEVQNQIKFDQIIKKLNQYWKTWEKRIKQRINDLCEISTTLPNQNLPINKIFDISQSNILKTQQEAITLTSFFDDFQNKVLKFNLLFKASSNGFSTDTFHAICDNIQNTLVVLQTNFNKKIGGFTPLKWTDQKNRYFKDIFGTSFIFSLSNKDKFSLFDKTKAIKNRPDRGPIFGYGYDLLINNNGNESISYANISQSYKNQKYKWDDIQSYKLFSGGETSQFKILEWQVYKVEFQGETTQ